MRDYENGAYLIRTSAYQLKKFDPKFKISLDPAFSNRDENEYQNSDDSIKAKNYSKARSREELEDIRHRLILNAARAGNDFLKADSYKEAIKNYDEALSLINQSNPNINYSRILNNKGTALYHIEQYVEALRCFEKAIDINRDDAIAWDNKGITLDTLGQKEAAKIAFDEVERICDRNKSNAIRGP